MALPIYYNVRSVRVRWQVTLLAVSGIALVVGVFMILLAMSAGFATTLRVTGRKDNAMVVQRGSLSELTSWMSLEQRNLIMVDSRVARGTDGQPMASPEVVVVTNKPKRDGEPTNVTIRGVTPRAFEVHEGIVIRQGRKFTRGLNEIIVGEKIAGRIQGLDLGSTITLQKRDWEVVGVFIAGGGAYESEIWGDHDIMGPAFERPGGCNALALRLKDPRDIPAFDQWIRGNPQMQLQAVEERKYYEDQAGPLATILKRLAQVVSFIMGIGAVFGAMNTMYAIVAARTREIGTLRALGFSRRSILSAFLVESVFLAIVGGVVGCLLAIPMNGFSTGTGQTASFSEIAFAFRITPLNVAVGLVFAVIMGIVGGLLPALRAARLPIAAALREA